jgi:hypothetical protein
VKRRLRSTGLNDASRMRYLRSAERYELMRYVHVRLVEKWGRGSFYGVYQFEEAARVMFDELFTESLS